ncbi:hypothetical protein ACFQZE_24270 [Paenibacillus sp. GCM10027627]|uniref:hypothetical protein n=1 Tax=unclassified Paenibacillus TaxID=185978 RepID=UPI0036256635
MQPDWIFCHEYFPKSKLSPNLPGNIYKAVTSNEQQGSFILTMNDFLEAAEGHGERFTQTLEQFKVLAEE